MEKKYEEARFLAYCATQDTGSPRSVPKKHRGTYTAQKRLEVREYIAAYGTSIRQASKDFNIPKSTIQDIISGKAKALAKGAGRPLSYGPEKEQAIVSWILEMRDLHLPVSVAEVRQKAMEVVGEDNPSFKASNGWAQKFFKRNRFTLRAKTSLSQYLPKDLEERLSTFIASMKHHLGQKNYPMAFIGNMDETPVYFDLVPSKVVDRVGVKSCIVRTTGAEK